VTLSETCRVTEREGRAQLSGFSSYKASVSSRGDWAARASHPFRPQRRQQPSCLHFPIRHDERVAHVSAVEAQQSVIAPH
jgi:hypothetical protein